jgi:hypothetical protein
MSKKNELLIEGVIIVFTLAVLALKIGGVL